MDSPNKPKFHAAVVTAMVAVSLVVAMLTYTNTGNGFQVKSDDTGQSNTFIQPPIPAADVPFLFDTISAGSSTILKYETGSVLLIPDSAFVDDKGNLVLGQVVIRFREFNDAIDIYLSGIPMDYTVDGIKYCFESAAMCEIHAKQNGQEVYLKPGKNIEIMQVSYTTSSIFNLYEFDKDKGEWIEEGKDIPDFVDSERLLEEAGFVSRLEENRGRKVKPVEPKMTDPEKLSFSISFLEEDFPELSGFKDLLFEILETMNFHQPGENKIIWEDIEITRGNEPGKYLATFSQPNLNKKVSFTVTPVFENESYNEAMDVYKRKLAEYNSTLDEELPEGSSGIAALPALHRVTDSVNLAIESRNKLVAGRDNFAPGIEKPTEEQVLIEELRQKRTSIIFSDYIPYDQKQVLIYNIVSDEQLIKELNKIETLHEEHLMLARSADRDKTIRNNLIRSFQVDNFGIYNVDVPGELPGDRVIMANFRTGDKNLDEVINLVDKSRRAVYYFPRENHANFQYDPSTENLIWTLYNNSLYYFNDFKNIPENHEEKEFTFHMKKVNKPLDSYENTRKILKSL